MKANLRIGWLLAVLLAFTNVHAQGAGQWTWVSGDNTVNTTATYGTKGIEAAANKPGARNGHSGWRDGAGNFWVFGGQDNFGAHNDLWKYTTQSGNWTWVSGDNNTNTTGTYGSRGVAAASNKPGNRFGQSSWVDSTGNFWIFGGSDGNLVSYYNDLWKYVPGTGQWTWMSGSNSASNASGAYGTKKSPAAGNSPGARQYASTWTDGSGNLWLFGGQDEPGNYYNDLWEFVVATGQWAWISGDNAVNRLGVYGTKGTPSATTKPGARYGQSGWADAARNFWIFGGYGYAGTNSSSSLNDLWKYTPSTGQWTWMSGGNVTDGAGTYGTKLVPANANAPGARSNGVAITDATGGIWLFGGYGDDGNGTVGTLNDLWRWNTVSSQWTWTSGDNSTDATGIYGTKGSPAAANKPGARLYAAGWADATGKLWVMGGTNWNADIQNDLWSFSFAYSLPLQDLRLQVTARVDGSELVWQTIGEKNTTTFVIERSPDGIAFANIGRVAAIGSGDHDYSFLDMHPRTGEQFYRIQTIYADADTSYSVVVVLMNANRSRISVYPIPATAGVTVQLSDDTYANTRVKLLDLNGRPVSEQMITGQRTYIDLHAVASGIYILQFVDGVTVVLNKQ